LEKQLAKMLSGDQRRIAQFADGISNGIPAIQQEFPQSPLKTKTNRKGKIKRHGKYRTGFKGSLAY